MSTGVISREALINSSMNYQSTKKGKCDFPFFSTFNDLLVIENGSTSLCCGNSELIRVSFIFAFSVPGVLHGKWYVHDGNGFSADQ